MLFYIFIFTCSIYSNTFFYLKILHTTVPETNDLVHFFRNCKIGRQGPTEFEHFVKATLYVILYFFTWAGSDGFCNWSKNSKSSGFFSLVYMAVAASLSISYCSASISSLSVSLYCFSFSFWTFSVSGSVPRPTVHFYSVELILRQFHLNIENE